MKIEKLNENQILFILSQDDLASNKISVHSFMANSKETQDFLLHILEIAESNYNFLLKDSTFSIEAMAIMNNSFIFTITRTLKNNSDCTPVENAITAPLSVFRFDSLDDFNDFFSYSKDYFHNTFENINLYYYQSSYFLILNENNFPSKFFLLLSEFASKSCSDIISKIYEFGSILI